MKNKRGVGSHVEIIISFMLFFLFVVFLLFFIRPYESSRLTDSVISGLHDSFRSQTQTNFTKFFLRAEVSNIEDYNSEDCFYVELEDRLFNFEFGNVLVKEVSEGVEVETVISQLTENKLKITPNNKGKFYNIFISPDFPDNTNLEQCTQLTSYSLGNIEEKKIIFNKTIKDVETRYNQEYNQLKKDLNFPETFDFAILSDSGLEMQGIIPEGVEVRARDYIEEVLFDDGHIENVKFTIKIW